MITTSTETLNGHQYLVTRVDGVITNQIGCDTTATPGPTAVQAAANNLARVLISGSATQQQRDNAQAVILALLIDLANLN